MNHDFLSSAIHSSLLSVYKILLEEYKNEDLAKRNTLKIAKEVLIKFGMKGDLSRAYESLSEKYNKSTDEAEKFELYKKLTTLQNALAIVKEVD